MSWTEPVPIRLSLPSDGGAVPEVAAEFVNLRAGYGEVFAAHQHRLLRLAYLLTDDHDRAEDVVAESFAKVWPHWRRGRVVDERGYLTRAVVNELRSAGRRLGRADRLAVKVIQPDEATREDDAVANRVAVVAALAKLPRRQREVVVLRFYEDLTEKATAALLGMRLGTVKSQTARGLSRLRQLLSEEDR